MAQLIEDKKLPLPDFMDVALDPPVNGVVMPEIMAYNVVSPKTVAYAENMNNDTMGYMTTRLPLVDFDYNASNPISPTGQLINAIKVFEGESSSSVYWQEGTDIVRSNVNGIGRNVQTNISAGVARFDVFRNKIFLASSGSAVRVSDGSSSFANVSGLTGISPNPNLISLGFNGMGWFANSTDKTCTLFNTDPIPTDPASMTYSAPSQNGAGFIQLPSSNNQTITALIPTQQALYVFFQNQIIRVFSTSNVDTTPIAYIGTPRQEAITRAKDGYYFFHKTGIYRLNQSTSNGIAQPEEISAPIRTLIRRADNTGVVSWSDDDNVYFNLGRLQYVDKSLDRSYVVRYTISTKSWTIYSFKDRTILAATTHYFTGSTSGKTAPVSYIAGYVNQPSGLHNFVSEYNNINYETIDSVAQGDGTPIGSTVSSGLKPIPVEYVTHWQDFGMPLRVKTIGGVSIYHENASGLTLQCQTDNEKDKNQDWITIGSLSDKFVTNFSQFNKKEFYRIRFRVVGFTKGELVRVGQPVISHLDIDGKRKK